MAPKDIEVTDTEKRDHDSLSDEVSEDPNAAPMGKDGKKMIQDGNLWVLDVPMRQFDFVPPGFKEHMCFNPLASLIGIVALWGLAIWCMVKPEEALAKLLDARSEVAHYFTCKSRIVL